MKKILVFMPSDPMGAYIKKGRTYKWLEQYYNPGDYFDEVYCLSPWPFEAEKIGKIKIIQASIKDFARIIKDIRPTVVRGYGGYCCADWISVSKVKGIPTVVSVHDKRPEMIHDSLEYADAIICTSKAVLDAVRKKVNIRTDNIWILPNRIDIDNFKKKVDKEFFSSLDKRFGKRKHILHIGRKSEEKNLDTLIRSLRYIKEDVSLICIGQGDTDFYSDLACKENVRDKCYFLDRIEHDELPLWYSWCDCFCVPSRSEGFGCVFVEAAACEAAVVSSDISPMNEYLENKKNAILVKEYENPLALAQAVEYILCDSDQVRIMRHNARNVCFRFEKMQVDEQEIEIYKEVSDIKANNRTDYNLRVRMNYNWLKSEIKKKLRSFRTL